MRSQQIKNKHANQFAGDKQFLRNFSIGIFIGMVFMIVVGILIDNVPLGIATGPALGTGVGFGINGIVNRKKENYSNQSINSGKTKMLIALFIAGLILCLLTLVYLIN